MDRNTRDALTWLNSKLIEYGDKPLTRWPASPKLFLAQAIRRRHPGATDIRLVPGEYRFWGPKGLHVGTTPKSVNALLSQAS